MERRIRMAREFPRVTVQLEKELKKWYQENKATSREEQEANPTLGHFHYERSDAYSRALHCFEKQNWQPIQIRL